MSSYGIVDAYMLFSFLRRLTNNLTSWDAYKQGVIDQNGQILIDPNKRTREQNKSFTKFDVLILNLRKLLASIPGGKSRIANFAAALYLIREDKEYEDMSLIEKELKAIISDNETFPLMESITNTANPSAIAGLDNPPKFAGSRVFDVDRKSMMKTHFGKKRYDRYKKYIGEEENCDEITSYCRKNPKESVILRDRETGAMMFLRRGKNK